MIVQTIPDHAVVVAVDDGSLGDRLPDLRWRLHDLVVAGASTIVIDLSRATKVGSETLAALLGTHRACRARGGGVILRNPGRQATDVMQRTGLMRVFAIEAPMATQVGGQR